MSNRLTIVVRIKAKAGMESRVQQKLTKLLAPTRAEQGCINFDLHRAADDPSLFLVHENWISDEALQKHFAMPYLRAWLADAEALLAAPMELTRWYRVG